MASVPEGRCEPSLLARSLETLAKEVEDARSGLEQRLAVTPVEEFALKEGATRDHLRDCYGKCFKEVGAISKEPGDKFLDCRPILDEMVKKNYRMPDVRDAYDSLIVAEENWGNFYRSLRKNCQRSILRTWKEQSFFSKETASLLTTWPSNLPVLPPSRLCL